MPTHRWNHVQFETPADYWDETRYAYTREAPREQLAVVFRRFAPGETLSQVAASMRRQTISDVGGFASVQAEELAEIRFAGGPAFAFRLTGSSPECVLTLWSSVVSSDTGTYADITYSAVDADSGFADRVAQLIDHSLPSEDVIRGPARAGSALRIAGPLALAVPAILSESAGEYAFVHLEQEEAGIALELFAKDANVAVDALTQVARELEERELSIRDRATDVIAAASLRASLCSYVRSNVYGDVDAVCRAGAELDSGERLRIEAHGPESATPTPDLVVRSILESIVRVR